MPILSTFSSISERGYDTPYPWNIVTVLQPSGGANSQWFGQSIDLNDAGNVAIIGSCDTDNSAQLGNAYIFIKSGSTWSQQQILTASDAAAGDLFANVVAINASGNMVVIGAEFAKIGPGPANTGVGAAYVFTYNGSTWSQQQKLIASDGASGYRFGSSVATNYNGNVIIVGSVGNTSAYIFTYNGSTWTQQQKISNVGANSVAINYIGGTVLIGANATTVSGNVSQGSAYVYTYNGSTWTQEQQLTASDGVTNARFGTQVKFNSSGNIAYIGGGYNTSSVNPGGVYVFTSSGNTWTQQQRLVPLDPENTPYLSNLGRSISVNNAGNIVIASSPDDRIGVVNRAGSAYTFTNYNSWQQQQKIINPLLIANISVGGGSSFGRQVAVNGIGNIGLIGVPFRDGATGAGNVYVIENNYVVGNVGNGQWVEQQQFIGNTFFGSDGLGRSVALNSSGNILLGGAYGYNVPPANLSAGGVYTYVFNGINWQSSQIITSSDGVDLDYFGHDVATNSAGNVAIIGAPTINNPTYWRQGNAYIFTYSGITWSEQQKITASDGTVGDWFGASVDINSNGNIAIIGASFANVSGNNQQGAAYIFTRSGSTWTQQQKLTASDGAGGDWFGYNVAINSAGNVAIVGAFRDDYSGYTDAGSAYVFTYNGSTWTQQQKLVPPVVGSFYQFGVSVNLNSTGNIAIIGASGAPAEYAYIFTYNGSTWNQQQRFGASGAPSSRVFGISVDLNSVGNVAIIGAYGDGGANGRGASYVFTYNGSTWSEQQKLTVTDTTSTNPGFGRDVALDSNGNIALIGAPGYDTSGSNSEGAVYIFKNN